MSIDKDINIKCESGDKMWAILIDPDKTPVSDLETSLHAINSCSCDFIFVGGSQLFDVDFHKYVLQIKSLTKKKVLIFPGDQTQISSAADGILLLSLISGRNPDLLIGKHIQSSYALKRAKINLLPTGYMLIDGGKTSSVQYISNTLPIPEDKFNIAASTALAGEQLGLKYIYMDAGSGAKKPISKRMIKAVRSQISVPLIIGGGIKNHIDLQNAWLAGADIVVIGNAIEESKELIYSLNSRIKCN